MERNRNALLAESKAQINTNVATVDAEKRNIENHPVWKECGDMVIIDWNDGREALLKNGVSVREIFSGEEWNLERQEGCIVRNFPALTVKEAHLSHCIFENCGSVTLEEGTAARCEFVNVETVHLDNTKIYNSVFRDMRGQEGELMISLEDSTVSNCTFRDIRLQNGCYLGDGVGDCLVEKCEFDHVTTDRKDGQLFRCEDTKGKLFKRRVEYDMVDRRSSKGLDGGFAAEGNGDDDI